MKLRAIILCALLAFLLWAALGCAQAEPGAISPASTRTEYLCWSPDLMPGAALWRDETAKRFPGAVVLVTHGADATSCGGPVHWVIDADPDLLCAFLKQAFPGRTIVLAACNPRGDALHTQGVFYVRDIVWTPPDDWWLIPRDRVKQKGTGSIWDFVEGKP